MTLSKGANEHSLWTPFKGTIVKIVSFLMSQRTIALVGIVRIVTAAAVHCQRGKILKKSIVSIKDERVVYV